LLEEVVLTLVVAEGLKVELKKAASGYPILEYPETQKISLNPRCQKIELVTP
jgi:hypothetical protein